MIRTANEVQNPKQNQKLKYNNCIIKIYPIEYIQLRITPLTRMDTNNLPP